MSRKKQVSPEKRVAIIALRNAGYSYREIARLEKVSYGAVQSTLTRFNETKSINDRPRSGRPRVTTKQDDLFVTISSKRNRFHTARDIRANLLESREANVSISTIKRRLGESGLKGCVAARKPLLRQQNKIKRLAWAKNHKNWTEDQWKQVLFSDESKFEIFGSNRRQYVRRKVGERMISACIQPTVKHGGGSIMVWGCFGGNAVGDLVKIDGIMDSKVYHNILVRHVIPSGIRLIGQEFTFQQDNDPKHTSKLCKNYAAKKEEEKVLKNMIWPPQSPDCNPIELLWDHLDRCIRDVQITSKTHLWEVLQQKWNAIGAETLDNLIKRMPRICKAVIKAKGGFFDERNV